MHRFTVFEAEQQAEGTARKTVNEPTVTAKRMSSDKARATPLTAVSIPSALGVQEALEEVGPNTMHGREETVTMPLSSESPITPDTSSQFPAWPWPGQAVDRP